VESNGEGLDSVDRRATEGIRDGVNIGATGERVDVFVRIATGESLGVFDIIAIGERVDVAERG
jgi:hypothetical protein